jgi:serine/threonine protein kinase
MNVISTRTDDTASQVDLVWQLHLDDVACGECSVDDFVAKLLKLSRTEAGLAWNVVALLDQRFRRGEVPVDLYRRIESKIVHREVGAHRVGSTIELDTSAPGGGATIEEFELGPPFKVTTERFSVPTGSSPPVTAPSISAPMQAHDRWESPAAEIGRVLRNRYVLEARLGRGGMGTVFKALDRYRCDLPEDNRYVAIKFLHESAAGRPEILSSLRSEFHCAQALSHPNIVKVYELDQDDDAAFFTMEFLEGELLSDVIERLKPQAKPRSHAWAIIRDLGAGLAHAHARNVAHGDLKPQNIMITRSGEVRILDFGASSSLYRLRTNSTMLTPAYASCELLAGAAADPRDDLYALACVSYELLAGQHPFQRRRSTEARALRMVAQRPDGLSQRQWETLAIGLSWDRQNRSISIGDWIAMLDPPPVVAQRWVRRAAGVLAVLLAGGILWTSFNRPPFGRNIGDAAAVPQKTSSSAAQSVANAPIVTDGPIVTDAAPTAAAKQDVSPAENPAQAAQAVQAAQAARTAQMPPLPRHAGTGAALPASRQDNISISAGHYRIGSRRNFAEIQVRRSPSSDGDTSFVWWTEPSSALPGVDYVPQARMTQQLPNGLHMASLFVRLVPHSRNHSAAFYVAIGEPGNGTSLGRVSRTTVLLPASR